MVRATVEEVAFGGRQRLILKNPFSPKLFPPHPLLPRFFSFFLVARSFNITHFPFLYSVPGLGGFCLLQQIQIKKISFDLARALSSLFFLLLHIFFAGEVISFFFSFLFPFFSGAALLIFPSLTLPSFHAQPPTPCSLSPLDLFLRTHQPCPSHLEGEDEDEDERARFAHSVGGAYQKPKGQCGGIHEVKSRWCRRPSCQCRYIWLCPGAQEGSGMKDDMVVVADGMMILIEG